MRRKKRILGIILGLASLLVACSTRSHQGDIPILLYHSVVPELEEGQDRSMYVSQENFARDLAYLREEGYQTISIDDVEKYYRGEGVDLPHKPVVITFDDGYKNNYDYAYPILRENQAQAIIYMVGWSVGRDTLRDKKGPITPHFSYEEAREMLDSGLIELGSHTFDLHNEEGYSYGYGKRVGFGLNPYPGEPRQAYLDRIREDLARSKREMEEELNREVKSLAYPYGQYNEDVIQIMKELGYTTGLITESPKPSESQFEIKRIIITEDKRVSDIL